MCHPAVMIAFTALQAGAQYMGQEKQSKATFDHLKEKQRQTIATGADAARHQWQGVNNRMAESAEAANLDVRNATKKYMEASASARTSSAAGNVSGQSVADVTQQFSQRFADYQASRMQNLNWDQQQLLATSRGIQAQYRGRIEGSMFAPVARPSAMEAAMKVVGSVFDAYEAFPKHAMWGAS